VARQVTVKALRRWHGFVTLATFPVTMQNGDTLGARALSDGTVQVYVNCRRIGSADTRPSLGNAYVGKGGRIGLWFEGALHATFDDFGGGNVTP
jgi:hypothetical protein